MICVAIFFYKLIVMNDILTPDKIKNILSGLLFNIVYVLALVGRWNVHGFAVFGDSAAGDSDALGSEFFGDVVVAVGDGAILRTDNFLNKGFNGR